MIIKLRDGRQIKLEYSFLTLQYLEEYPGGIKQLEKDYKAKSNQLKIICHIIYALINTSLDVDNLTYKQAINLVYSKDVEKCVKFVFENMKNENDFKKKQYHPASKKRKKK